MLVRQVKFAFDLLEYLAARRTPATLTEISDHFGWPRSSTFNLIETLTASGYLHEPRPRGGYYPTRRLLTLATTLTANEPLPDNVIAAVSKLATATNESAILGGVSGLNAVYLDVVESSQSIRYHAKVGDLAPLYATAIGRALLSQMEPREIQQILARSRFVRFAENTPMTEAAVMAEIELVRQRGYSVNDNGYQPYLLGVAVPFSLEGRKLGLLIAGPSIRMAPRVEEFAELLRRQVEAIQARAPRTAADIQR